MSHFKSLPSDNVKKGPKSDSIFYRSQDVLTNQYKNERIKQQKKQKELIKNIPIKRNIKHNKLKPVRRIALGGNTNNNNNNNRSRAMTINKVDTRSQLQLLRKYKKKYSRSSYDDVDNRSLPSGTTECILIKECVGTYRSFVGHFNGSKAPRYPKSKIYTIREKDLQTQIEQIQYDTRINAKIREELIAKLKFGLMEENEQSNRGKHYKGREFWFRFEEQSKDDKNNKNKNKKINKKNKNKKNNNTNSGKVFLGKPKLRGVDQNYSYALLRWDGNSTRIANVYPSTFIEFNLENQLISDISQSSESLEHKQRNFLKEWRRKQAQKSIQEKLGRLFGHDDPNNIQNSKSSLKGDQLSDDFKLKLKETYLDKNQLDGDDKTLLRDIFDNDEYNAFMEEYNELHENDNDNSLQTSDDISKSLIQDKKLSSRILRNKTRGQLENLADYDEFISDDEDETNLNNYDRVDDAESDHLTDDNNSSEDDADFIKLCKNLEEDIQNKDYELPDKLKKDKNNDIGDDDDYDDDDDKLAWQISDDDDDDDDNDDDDVYTNDGNVKIIKKNDKKRKRNDNNNNNNNNNNQINQPKAKKRKLNNNNNNNNNNISRETQNDLKAIIMRILKKSTNGIEMGDLWGKIVAVSTATVPVIKTLLPIILKKIAKRKQINGKRVWLLRVELK